MSRLVGRLVAKAFALLRLVGHAVFLFEPLAQVDQAASLAAEGGKGDITDIDEADGRW